MDLNLFAISIVEGITEFLPISSTAHLIILGKILSVDLSDPYIKFYLLAIQFGALLAGIFLFTKKIILNKKLFVNIVVSFIPSAVAGFILYQTFKQLLEGNIILLSSMLLIGGIILVYIERFVIKNLNDSEFGKEDMTKTDALIVGMAQAIAIIPGVSRSGATIVSGILRGIKKSTIIEYTFLLAIPTLGSAVAYDTYKSREMFFALENYSALFLGIFISFLTALITLYVIRKHIRKISLSAFGIYRIILSLIIFFVYLF